MHHHVCHMHFCFSKAQRSNQENRVKMVIFLKGRQSSNLQGLSSWFNSKICQRPSHLIKTSLQGCHDDWPKSRQGKKDTLRNSFSQTNWLFELKETECWRTREQTGFISANQEYLKKCQKIIYHGKKVQKFGGRYKSTSCHFRRYFSAHSSFWAKTQKINYMWPNMAKFWQKFH